MTADMETSGTGRNVIYTLKVETDPRAKAELQKFKQSVLDMFQELGAKQAESREHAMRGSRPDAKHEHGCCSRMPNCHDMHSHAEREKSRHEAEVKSHEKEMHAQAKELVEGVKESAESFRSLLGTMAEFGLVSKETKENFDTLWEAMEKGAGIIHNMTGVWTGVSKALSAYSELAAAGKGGLSGLSAAGAFGPTVSIAGAATPVALMATAALSAVAGLNALGRMSSQWASHGFMGGGASAGGLEDRYATGVARVLNLGGINESDANTERMANGLREDIRRKTGWGDYWQRQGEQQLEEVRRTAPGEPSQDDDFQQMRRRAYGERTEAQWAKVRGMEAKNEAAYARAANGDTSDFKGPEPKVGYFGPEETPPKQFTLPVNREDILNQTKVGVEMSRQYLTLLDQELARKRDILDVSRGIVAQQRDAYNSAKAQSQSIGVRLGSLSQAQRSRVFKLTDKLMSGNDLLSPAEMSEVEPFLTKEQQEEVNRRKEAVARKDPEGAKFFKRTDKPVEEAAKEYEALHGESIKDTEDKEEFRTARQRDALRANPEMIQRDQLRTLQSERDATAGTIQTGQRKIGELQKSIAAVVSSLANLARALNQDENKSDDAKTATARGNASRQAPYATPN